MQQPHLLTYQSAHDRRTPARRARWILLGIIASLTIWIVEVRKHRPVTATPPPTAGVEIADRLDRRLPELTFDGVPFKDVIDFLADASFTKKIRVDWNHLATIGLTPDTPINARLRNIKFSKVLAIILADADSHGTGVSRFECADDGTIVITSQDGYERDNTIVRAYDIRDLLAQVPADSRASLSHDICRLITDTVESDTWIADGGNIGRIRECAGLLIISQTRENHKQIQNLLEQLRKLRSCAGL